MAPRTQCTSNLSSLPYVEYLYFMHILVLTVVRYLLQTVITFLFSMYLLVFNVCKVYCIYIKEASRSDLTQNNVDKKKKTISTRLQHLQPELVTFFFDVN